MLAFVAFGKGVELSAFLPIIIAWLLFHIHGLNMQVNSRIDAIVRIMNEDEDAKPQMETPRKPSD